MKPKRNYTAGEYTPAGMDACQTPEYALQPIYSALNHQALFWEPAAGEGYLARSLGKIGEVIATDITTGENFFDFEKAPDDHCIIVTNPPYGIKKEWLAHTISLGQPFALLMPVEFVATAGYYKTILPVMGQITLVIPNKRINFKMPNKGWGGSAQFPTMWYTWGLFLPGEVWHYDLDREWEVGNA